jgi:hypothetical protein
MKISNIKHPVNNKNSTSFNTGFPDGVQGEMLRDITIKTNKGFKFINDDTRNFISGH